MLIYINITQLNIKLKYLFFNNLNNLLIIAVNNDLLLDIKLNNLKKMFLSE